MTVQSSILDACSSLTAGTTAKYWTTVANATFSPRALGWVTQASSDTYQGCGDFSPQTFYHTGMYS
jgi:hypothetical protein